MYGIYLPIQINEYLKKIFFNLTHIINRRNKIILISRHIQLREDICSRSSVHDLCVCDLDTHQYK